MTRPRVPHAVTAHDLERCIDDAADALRSVAGQDWQVPAKGVRWSCWESIEQVADDLFSYALQLGPKPPPRRGYVKVVVRPQRKGGPASTIFAEAADNTDLVTLFSGCGALLVSMVRQSSPDVRAYHPYGLSDPEGFAAMGIVETLVHVHDVTQALDQDWSPPEYVCGRVLFRLFPELDVENCPWQTLLWATGRESGDGRPRRKKWRWDARPAADRQQ
jgi:hypothetical protein